MKRILFSLIALYLSIIVVYGQSLVITQTNGNLVNNGDTITSSVTAIDHSFIVRLDVINVSNNDLDVKVKKIELDTLPGTVNYLCWDLCYPPFIYTSANSVTIASEDTNRLFYGEYESHNQAGKTRIMYVFFDVNNPNDSAWAVVEYHSGSGVFYTESNKETSSINAFPNPTNGIINFEYQLEESYNTAELIISNVLGETILRKPIINSDGKMVLDLNGFESGIYFYSIILDNNTILSRKFVIN